jgi:hypothetical protein
MKFFENIFGGKSEKDEIRAELVQKLEMARAKLQREVEEAEGWSGSAANDRVSFEASSSTADAAYIGRLKEKIDALDKTLKKLNEGADVSGS